MANNIILRTGYSTMSVAECAPTQEDAGGQPTFLMTGVVGAGILLPPSPSGQQIDAIYASAIGDTSAANWNRIIVLYSIGTLDNLAAWVRGNALGSLGAMILQTAPSVVTGLYVPDLSTGRTNSQLAGVQNQLFNIGGIVVALDYLAGGPLAGTSAQAAGAPLMFSSRPGGGLVIPPQASVAVLNILTRLTSNAAPVASDTVGTSASLTVCGGQLLAGQTANASAAPEMAEARFPNGGPARFDNTLIPGRTTR